MAPTDVWPLHVLSQAQFARIATVAACVDAICTVLHCCGALRSASHGIPQSISQSAVAPASELARALVPSVPLLWLRAAPLPWRRGSKGVHRYSSLAALPGAEAARATVVARPKAPLLRLRLDWMGPPAPLAAASNHRRRWGRVTLGTLPPSPNVAALQTPVSGLGCGRARTAQAVCGGADGDDVGEPGGLSSRLRGAAGARL